MNQFNRAGKGKERPVIRIEKLSSGQRQNGSYPLPAGEKRVMHRLMERLRMLPALSQIALQRAIDQQSPIFEVAVQVEVGHLWHFSRLWPEEFLKKRRVPGLVFFLPIIVLV